MGDYRKLLAWQAADRLAQEAYRAAQAMLAAKHYELANQITRAAVSIPANLAEGCGRRSDRELRQFAKVARGSATELEYLLSLAAAVAALDSSTATRLAIQAFDIQRMLASLLSRLNRPRPTRR